MTSDTVIAVRADPDAPVLAEQAAPPLQVKPGHVLVRTLATSVNPIDAKRARGYGARVFSLMGANGRPLVLGNDVVGEVEVVGDGVSTLRVGDEVLGVMPTGPLGAHRTQALLPAALVRRMPEGVSALEAVVMPYTFCTLMRCLDKVQGSPERLAGARVLIQGGATALGQLATQLLSQWGASVTVICGQRSRALCLSLGAVKVLDRHDDAVERLQSTFQLTLNFGHWSNDAALVARLAPNALGHATTVHPLLANIDRYGLPRGGLRAALAFAAMRRTARRKAPSACYAWVVYRPAPADMDHLVHALAMRQLRLDVGPVVPFARAAEAFDATERGSSRRTVLVPHRPLETC
jgi:NADPH:quinone reductase-like Zn-dependent oxidoreductase